MRTCQVCRATFRIITEAEQTRRSVLDKGEVLRLGLAWPIRYYLCPKCGARYFLSKRLEYDLYEGVLPKGLVLRGGE